MRFLLLFVTASSLALGCTRSKEAAPAAPPSSGEARFDAFVERFLAESYYPQNPTAATAAGEHKYDSLLEDFSRPAITARVAMLQRFYKELSELDPRSLGPVARGDRAILLGVIVSA